MNLEDVKAVITQARAFQAHGQTGKSRVLARRVVGAACHALLQSAGQRMAKRDALSAIRTVLGSDLSNPEWDQSLSHFLLHVDRDHQLPPGIDLVEEAQTLTQDIIQKICEKELANGEN